MSKRILIAVVALALPMSLAAESPNLEAGLWEFTNTTKMDGGGMNIPEEENSYQECVTEEELADADFMLEDMEECDISNLEQSSAGMSFTMVCEQPEMGMTITMDSEARFLGDRMEGSMSGRMEGPMGEMDMEVTTRGERLDDC